jgi:BirA family biotin operon repressor/biotin-[acetyl-CoA-carboxylase] ligase
VTQDFQVAVETVERFGRPMRTFPVAVSAEAMAMSWANKEQAPQGAAVVVEHEIGPRGFLGRLWKVPPARSLTLAMVLRPPLSVEEADATWLVPGLAGVQGAEAAAGRKVGTWWPDRLVELDSRAEVASLYSNVQLGPGQIKYAVVVFRLDLGALGLDPSGKDRLIEALVHATDEVVASIDEGGSAGLAKAYGDHCVLLGQRVKLQLRPKGETRGTVRLVDRTAKLQLESPSGMVERIGIDQLRELSVF